MACEIQLHMDVNIYSCELNSPNAVESQVDTKTNAVVEARQIKMESDETQHRPRK